MKRILNKTLLVKNLIIFQFAIIFILIATISFLPNISISSIAAEFVPIIAPWIYEENFKKTITENQDEIVGYVNHHSVSSGKSFKLFLSTNNSQKQVKGTIEIYRIGYYENMDRNMVFKSETIMVIEQPVSITSFVTGMPWKALDKDISTKGWKSGYYTFDFIGHGGKRTKDFAYVVVTNPQKKGNLLVKLSTNTYQAYNKYGGGSLYKSNIGGSHADVVSFNRPTRSQFFNWEYYYVIWLEKLSKRLGITIDYATNYDFYKDADISNKYKLLISLGHDEYWSQNEFNSFYDRIFKKGENTLFLGANTAYWRVRYGNLHNFEEGRELIVYKNSLKYEGKIGKANFDPVIYSENGKLEDTGLFRGQLGFPETMLMGVGYESYFDEIELRVPYKVKTIIPWIFKGTNLKPGDKVADVVGYEWDNSSLVSNGYPVWSAKKSNIPILDRDKLQVVFEGKPVAYNGKQGLAQAVYFETNSGAKVFSAGTIRWAWGVGKPGFVNDNFVKINENLITELIN